MPGTDRTGSERDSSLRTPDRSDRGSRGTDAPRPGRSPLVPGAERGAPSTDDLRRRLDVEGRPNSGVTPEVIKERFKDRDERGRPHAGGGTRTDVDAVRRPRIRGPVDGAPRVSDRNPGLRRLPRAPEDRIRAHVPERDGPVRGDDWFRAETYNQHHASASYWHDHHYGHRDYYHPHHSHYYDFHLYHPSWCISFGLHYGYDFGFVFCRDRFGYLTHLYWYYRFPGFRACYVPYTSYYRPSCSYYPSYAANYSTVYYVREEIVEAEGIPDLPASEIIDPDLDILELMDLGWDLFFHGDYAGAAEAFRQATLKAPEDANAKFAFSQALFAIGNYPDAAFLLRRGMELDPTWPTHAADPRERYGDPLDHEEQRRALETFLEFVPADPSATLLLAVQSYTTGDVATAQILFEELVALDPEDAVAIAFLAALAGR